MERQGDEVDASQTDEFGKKGQEPSRLRRLKEASAFKRQTFFALEDMRCACPLARVVGIGLFVLIVANAAVAFVWVDDGANPFASSLVAWFYRVSTVCFFAEYLARLWTADVLYSSLSPGRARLRYALSFMGVIDLLAFLPNVVSWFVPLTDALKCSVNLLRLVRLVKVSRYMRGLETICRVVSKRRHEIVASVMVLLLLVVVTSVLMYEVEHDAQPDVFDTMLTGVYWSVTTVTGTGFGDIAPITAPGRLLGSIIMVLSVGIVAIPGGILSAGFVAEFQNTSERRIERLLRDDGQDEREGRQPETCEQASEQAERAERADPAEARRPAEAAGAEGPSAAGADRSGASDADAEGKGAASA
ncbi:ion transporter [Eggerthellaceae bacterium zg-893]|nr:ion transporter [Eggerthellaceae bacterium zg-893]